MDGSSILKYEYPVLARPGATFDMTNGHDSLPQYVSLYASIERRPVEAGLRLAGVGAAVPGISRHKRRSHGDRDENVVLKAILPNKEYVNEAGEWVQAVSTLIRWFTACKVGPVPKCAAVQQLSTGQRVGVCKVLCCAVH